MKAFYHPLEQDYRPQHSFFLGRFTPYPDVAGRTRSILEALRTKPAIRVETPAPAGPKALVAVHGPAYLETLEALCARLKPEEAYFPFHMRPLPRLLDSPYPRIRMGYFALDASTPLLACSYPTALAAAGTALAGARALLDGEPLAYALPRPPGHHAGRESYGGYCLLNHAALAAHALTPLGKVAILDVDYHHGNGSQDIFWARDDVLYVSLHCRPEEAYPYVAGGADERGAGPGRGFTRNLPLPGGTDWGAYRPALETALETIQAFQPATVVVSLGFDTLASDPIGTFRLAVADYEPMGRLIGSLGRPLLIVQEGGYDVAALGACALRFLAGLGLGGSEAPSGDGRSQS